MRLSVGGHDRTGSICPESGWDRKTTNGASASGGSGFTAQNINSSFPVDGPDADAIRDDGWEVDMNNTGAGASSFNVYAICTTPTGVS